MTEHGLNSVCIGVPFVITDIDSVDEAHTLDIENYKEATQQGCFRRHEYVTCECGEEFTGRSCFKEYKAHLVESLCVKSVEHWENIHECADWYDVTFTTDDVVWVARSFNDENDVNVAVMDHVSDIEHDALIERARTLIEKIGYEFG